MDETVQALHRLFRVRIVTGDHAGAYVSTTSGFRLVGASQKYFLHPEERLAYQFFEVKAPSVQTELKSLGYVTELVEVTQVRDRERDTA